jgi:hypothetical protein
MANASFQFLKNGVEQRTMAPSTRLFFVPAIMFKGEKTNQLNNSKIQKHVSSIYRSLVLSLIHALIPHTDTHTLPSAKLNDGRKPKHFGPR